MKTRITTVIAGVSFFAIIMAATQASALGYKVSITTKNDSLNNSGEIYAEQNVLGGAGNQKVWGLRVRSQEDLILEYESQGNTYTNSGVIKGEQKVVGGAGNQAVGLEVY